jgi:hypothetical protein
MAKKKQVFIEVIVDDKGTTQRLAVDANKLEKALVGQNKQTKDADRALRGAASMSSNTTKNFSKMTQGINGGIVPAYAELAARVFAVTAAFRFLQEAADTRNLIAGQQQFGALMGTNYSAITKSLQEATNGQLRFTEAAQATAIGTAAGLTGNQLERLATVAKNASFALGRDLTDSFNRLIRGTTKAEPELLDELGIILRLDPATKAYAAATGRAANELTAFERTQAVTNFVLEEGERKFAAIGKVMNEDATAVAEFGKAFDDIVNTIKVGLVNGLTPVLQFLSNNVTSLVSLFGLLALPLVRSVLPTLDAFGQAAKSAGDRATAFADKTQAKFDELTKQTRVLGKDMDEVGKSSTDLAKGAGVKQGQTKGTGMSFLSGEDPSKRAQTNADKILKGAEKQIINGKKVTTGKLKGFNAQEVKDLRLSYEQRAQVVKKFEKTTRLSMKGIELSAKQAAAGTSVAFTRAFSGLAAGAKRLAGGVDLLFKAAGIAGAVLLFIDLGKMAKDALFPIPSAARRANEEVEGLSEKTAELGDHLAKVNEIRADRTLQNLEEKTIQFGNAIKEANVANPGGLIDQINSLDAKKGTEGFGKYRENLLETTSQLAKLDSRFAPLNQAILDNKKITEEDAKAILALNENAQKSANALQQITEARKAADQALQSTINSIAQAPFQNLVSAFAEVAKLETEYQVTFDKEKFAEDRAALQKEIEKFDKGTQAVTIKTRRGTTVKTGRVEQSAEDIARVEALEAQAAAEDAAVKAKEKAADIAVLNANAALEAQKEALDLEDNILDRKKTISKVDKVSQSFAAQRERAAIGVLNAETAVDKAKQQVLQSELALDVLRNNEVAETDQRVINANRALTLAEQNVEVEENNLRNAEKKNAVDQIGIDIAERRLQIQKDINAAQNALARARIAQERATTAGAGTVGKSLADIGTEKQEGRENNIIAQRKIINDQILQAEEKRAKLNATTNATRIVALDQEIEGLRIKGEQLDRNLEKEQTAVLIELEKGRLRSLDLADQMQTFSFSTAHEAAARRILELENAGHTVSAAQKEEFLAQNIALEEQETILKGMENLRSTVESSMNSAFMSIVDGSKSAKEAFADMAKSILAAIAKMIIELLVMKAIQATISLFGGGAPIPAGRNGMIAEAVPARRGGILQSYSTGGIARGRQAGYPAILHGTEAVVPLPNKKEIPVDIRGGTGDVNNISITVNSDGTTRQDGSNSSEQSKQLGRAISAAVQDELHKQKRPGGILSPFGAA